MGLQRIMWSGRIKQDCGNRWDLAKSRGQKVLYRNNKTDGIIQNQQSMQVWTGSTGNIGVKRDQQDKWD
jgi:hypothetical protein